MTREEIEQSIWQLLTMRDNEHLSTPGFVDAILILMDSYAAGDDKRLQSLRLEVLARESAE